jgi:hypothetical protein
MHARAEGILAQRGMRMPRIAMPDYLTHLRGLVTAALLLLGNSAVHAAEDCLADPKLGATQGAHWYYLTNHATHRKCWYLARPGTDRARAETAAAQAAPNAAPAAPAPSAVQQLVNALTGNSESNEPKPSDPNTTPAQPPGVHSPKATNATARPRHATRGVNRATEHPATLDRTQRDALFRDFLRWKAQQKDHMTQ